MNRTNIFFRILFISIIGFVLSCKSAYDKALKSGSPEEKEVLAKEYFEKEKYFKAGPLYKSLVTDYAATQKVEEMFYYYALCDFFVKDYVTAAYEFKRLAQRFPRGQYVEDSYYYAALSYYELSPPHFLDQQYTYQAIEDFELFLNMFPNSSRKEEVNQKVDELIKKLEKKAYESAYLYYKTGYYNSAVLAFKQVLNDFPDTDRSLKIRFLRLESAFKYAEESVENKKIERFEEAYEIAEDYLKYISRDPMERGEYRTKTEIMEGQIENKIKSLRKTVPEYYFKRRNYDLAVEEWLKLKNTVEESEKDAIDNLILNAMYLSAQEADFKSVYNKYERFEEHYNKLKSEGLREKYKSQYQNAVQTRRNLPKTIPNELYSRGRYYDAKKYAELYLDSAAVKDPAVIDIWRKATYEYAKTANVKVAESLYNKLVDDAQQNGNNKYAEKAQKKLKAYPMKLIRKPYKEGEYKMVVDNARDLLKERQVFSEDREEIVYLWIAASYRFAKAGQRYEKRARYERTQKIVNDWGQELIRPKYKKRLEKIKRKLKNKLKDVK